MCFVIVDEVELELQIYSLLLLDLRILVEGQIVFWLVLHETVVLILAHLWHSERVIGLLLVMTFIQGLLRILTCILTTFARSSPGPARRSLLLCRFL